MKHRHQSFKSFPGDPDIPLVLRAWWRVRRWCEDSQSESGALFSGCISAQLSERTGPPRWLSGKGFTYQCRRHRFSPWVVQIPWRRRWQPTAAFLLGESHGRRSLAGYSLWGRKESDITEQASNRKDSGVTVCWERCLCKALLLRKSQMLKSKNGCRQKGWWGAIKPFRVLAASAAEVCAQGSSWKESYEQSWREILVPSPGIKPG